MKDELLKLADSWECGSGSPAWLAARKECAAELRALAGWVLVPREPTQAMLSAFELACQHHGNRGFDAQQAAYRAMLAAAQPPKESE